MRSVDATDLWNSDLVAELEGVANGAGTDVWHIAAVNARTEILSSAPGARPGECTTIVRTATRRLAIQTWDWHEEMSALWHTQQISGTSRTFAGLTEHGILSKIGVNDAGVAVLLNILGHEDDGVGGLPIHLLTFAVLSTAESVEHALDILRRAPVSASSAITVVDALSAVTAEVSPAGIALFAPVGGWIAHSNHFLDDVLATGEKRWLYEPDSQDRLALVHSRLSRCPAPATTEELLPLLYSDPGQPALCCVPAPDAVFGDRWRTLATITVDAAERTIDVFEGSPIDARTARRTRLRALSQANNSLPTL
ncbi:Acyl-coenzyme A:6-aminopenicillanic acid acyl-transferase [Microbacterium sp. SA39]|nr:Acyl-coenzyme A:6-aminopenicillanic acid acyl-transferase [Microbacterium sp. SA39]